MITPQDRLARNELFERLLLYRWAYAHRSRYDSEPAAPVATAIASTARRLSMLPVHHAVCRGI